MIIVFRRSVAGWVSGWRKMKRYRRVEYMRIMRASIVEHSRSNSLTENNVRGVCAGVRSCCCDCTFNSSDKVERDSAGKAERLSWQPACRCGKSHSTHRPKHSTHFCTSHDGCFLRTCVVCISRWATRKHVTNVYLCAEPNV